MTEKQSSLLQTFRWASLVLQNTCWLYKGRRWGAGRSQWPHDLRRGSAVVRLLRLRVRIPPRPYLSVCCECCVLSGRGLCVGLITRPEDSYRLPCGRFVCSVKVKVSVAPFTAVLLHCRIRPTTHGSGLWSHCVQLRQFTTVQCTDVRRCTAVQCTDLRQCTTVQCTDLRRCKTVQIYSGVQL